MRLLSNAILAGFAPDLQVSVSDQARLTAGIVNVGLDQFPRAPAALNIDRALLLRPGGHRAVCGAGVRQRQPGARGSLEVLALRL